MIDLQKVRQAMVRARDDLLAARNTAGHWRGELANSAVSTATAVSALAIVARHAAPGAGFDLDRLRSLIDGGVAWLLRAQNPNGGWGDTDRSLSNIAATMLAQAALRLAGATEKNADSLRRADAYVEAEGGLDGLRCRYGKDKTFVVPILTNCALAGMVPWSTVPALPFELAVFPHGLFRFLRLPVVSYAIPALVAIGQARYFHAAPWNPVTRLVRAAAVKKSLARAAAMQPASGGYLEATPLTAFVTMSLAATGRAEHPIVRRGVEFLLQSARPDGGWPIDTDLATWLTSLSVGALAAGEGEAFPSAVSDELVGWLLDCQHLSVHPFTQAAPGGWGWTDLSGAVPDADDTPGALLALHHLVNDRPPEVQQRVVEASQAGLRWLLALQNRDGGWPTFCRGWGKLPFDRSGVDLTAHALRALHAWHNRFPSLQTAIDRATARGFHFLETRQRTDGAWVPLWFGNQHEIDEENPVYGTARVLLAYLDTGRADRLPARRGIDYLLQSQNADGGWGGGPWQSDTAAARWRSGLEETAVALEALASVPPGEGRSEPLSDALRQAAEWMTDRIARDEFREPSPIGFYFAKLWYYERLYPLIFSLAALGRLAARLATQDVVSHSREQQA